MSSTYKVDNIDSIFKFQDSTDPTKKATLNITNITPGETRTITVPDANITLVDLSLAQTLTNKIINADNNTLINITNAGIKVNASIDAAKIANSTVSNTEFQYLNGLGSTAAGINDSVVMTNKTFTDNTTFFQDSTDNSKKIKFQLSGISPSNTRIITVPDGDITLVGTNLVQTLINKTISASNNTITGLSNLDVGLGNVQNTKVNLNANTGPAVTDDTSSGYSVGSRWIDVALNKEYVCLDATNSDAVWTLTTSTSDIADLNIAQVRRTTVYSCTGSYANLTFDDTDIENDVTVIEHDNTNTDRLVTKETGLYQLSVICNFDSFEDSEPYVRIMKNGSTKIGSEYTNSTGNKNSFPLIQFTQSVNLTANDYLTVQIKDIGINRSSLRTDAVFSITRMAGIKGTQGSTGPSGEGESNTVSNIGSSGLNIYDSKSGVDLRFKKLANASTKLLIVDGGVGENLSLDVVESNIVIGNLSGAPTGSVVGTSDSQTLTSKTIDADNNTFSNISNGHIKAGAAIDASKIANGMVSGTEFQYLNGVTSSIQTQINTKAADSGVVHNTSTESIAGLKTFSNTAEFNTTTSEDNIKLVKSNSTSHWLINAGRSAFYDNWLLFKNENEVSDFTFAVSNSGQFKGKDGSAGAPIYTFTNASNYGMSYDDGANKGLILSTEGSARFRIEDDGTISVAGTTNYENLVLADDDIPNKKYVDDQVSGGGGNVDGPVYSTDNSVARFNLATGQIIQNSGVIINDSNDITGVKTLAASGSVSGYILDLRNTLTTGGGNGFKIRAGEVSDDIAFHIANENDTFQIMEMEANQGYITLGKTVAQTISDNGVAYCIDNQHVGTSECDFNTQYGVYRIGGQTVSHNTYFQDGESNGVSTTTNTTFQQKLSMTTPSLPSGKYRIGWSVSIKSTGDGEFRIHQNDTAELGFGHIDNGTPDYVNQGGFKYLSSLSGVQNIDLDYRAVSGTTSVKYVRLEIWRLS